MSYSNRAKNVMLHKAAQNFDAAKDNYKAERYDSCISDLYYSAFQTVTSLLVIRGEMLSKHTQVRAFVNRDLARKGLIDLSLAKMYNSLMDLRSDADYSTKISLNKEVSGNLLKSVEQFNSTIRGLIEKEEAK